MRRKNTRGFTATEVMVTLGLVAAMSAIGFSSSSQMKPRYQARKAAVEFNQAVAMAKQLATTNGVESRILLVEYDVDADDVSKPNRGQYRVQLGNRSANSDVWDTLPYENGAADLRTGKGTYNLAQGGSHYMKSISIEDWGAIAGPGSGNADAIVFSPMGMLENPATDLDAEGGITVNFVNKKTIGEARPDRTSVRIYRGGMVRMEAVANAPALADVGAPSTDVTATSAEKVAMDSDEAAY